MIVMKILGISGSLRKQSYNTAALRAAGELLPAGATLELFDLSSIPLYNEDIEPFPHPVRAFRAAIAQSDALLIATPEYNHSISGVLKNALDWASCTPDPPCENKPVAIFGVSTGRFGTLRAQLHLREICAALEMLVLPKPELFITHAREKFDAHGQLIERETRERLRALLEALIAWARLHAPRM
ncbi:MAG: NAD(P)H-dependent oxidoreductase [Candidatus Bipolaricaulota bacterium]|nr:NAD(P)H-dependent oxidoreductase [Candidatus Bipolaricaulota bacterium]